MPLPLQIDRTSAIPLQDQLFEQLRQLILGAKLKPNSRLIATRFLAEQLGVSRTTVLLAYERLISEGYLETRPAVGTFVAAAPPEVRAAEIACDVPAGIERQASLRPVTFNGFGNGHAEQKSSSVDFRTHGRDTSHLLSKKIWLKHLKSVLESEPNGLANPQPVAGVPALREAIADYLAATRGIAASPEQIFIVMGRQQACSFVSHLFQRPGDRVVVESPGDETVSAFFEARHAELVRVPVDEHGLDTDKLPEGPVSLAYVTPARQNPIGGTMTQERREALIDWARDAGAYLIEDSADCEFEYRGTALQPLAATDHYGLVFYTGSYAKTLGDGLGLGYLVVPFEFVDAVSAIKAMSQDGCAWLEQMVVASLLSSGEYEHHLRRVRKIYMERRDCLIGALAQHFGDVKLIGKDAGTQLTWLLPADFPPAQTVYESARNFGVSVQCVTTNRASGNGHSPFHDRALILSYSALSTEQLRRGVALLAESLSL